MPEKRYELTASQARQLEVSLNSMSQQDHDVDCPASHMEEHAGEDESVVCECDYGQIQICRDILFQIGYL